MVLRKEMDVSQEDMSSYVGHAFEVPTDSQRILVQSLWIELRTSENLTKSR